MPTTRKRTSRPSAKTTRRKTSSSGRTGRTRRTTKSPSRVTRTRAPGAETKTVADVMTADPVTLIESETILNAAKAMREFDIGDVIVLDDTSARVKGIVTDRDVVVRALAEEMDPGRTTLASIVSDELVCVAPTDSLDKAARFMRDRAVRRLPVIEDDQAVGVVSMGDLALELDRRSALAEISAAPPNA